MSRCLTRSAPQSKPWMPPNRPRYAGNLEQRRPSATRRRGVLLLVVLSMLTLFLMLGVAYLLAASRARDAARAFARLTFGSDEARIPAPALLDSMLLKVVRGPVAIVSGTTFESLLADKYGRPTTSGTPTLSGTLTGLTRAGSVPILTATLTTGSVHATDLVGRVLTMFQAGRPITSHRIVRALNSGSTNALSTSFSLTLDIPTDVRPFRLATGTVPAIINGREFASGTTSPTPGNENWDGFDQHNLFLAQLKSSTSSISRADVVRGSFLPPTSANTFTISGTQYTLTTSATSGSVLLVTGTTDFDNDLIMDAADNDGDGVIDGIFQDYGLPDATDAAGNTIQLRASVLVVDLDGRFNVNAHDSLPRLVYGGTANWPDAAVVATGSVPLGSGYGPSEVNGAKLFVNAPRNAPLFSESGGGFLNTENPTLLAITGGPQSKYFGRRSGTSGSRYTDDESTPRLTFSEGRYGERAANTWSNIEEQLISNGTPAKFARPGIPGVNDAASRINDRRADPTVAASISYGIPAVWWTGASTFNWASDGTGFPPPRGVFNSPPDLHGRMKTLTLSATGSGIIVPQVAFVQPEWSSGTATGGQHESRDDPYEFLVDTRLGRGGFLFDPSTAGSGTSASSLARDNPFTPAELEPVLRPYDVDTNKLPPRLNAMLGSGAEESRLKVTTDSWDTTAITGSAAMALYGAATGGTGWLQTITGLLSGTSSLSGVLGGDVARGERFDLNRAFTATNGLNAGYPTGFTALTTGSYFFDGNPRSAGYHIQRQAYQKDLFTLLMALNNSGSPDQLAQWAANVVGFRDSDSRVHPFEYDTNPSNGWDVDGDVTTADGGVERRVVWGVERPEIVIQEAFGWRNSITNSSGIILTLHRPWNAMVYGSGSIPAEPCDYCLDSLSGTTTGNPTNQVNLGKKPSSLIYGGTFSAADVLDISGTVYPIWRIRIDTGTSGQHYIAFTGTSSHWIGSGTITAGAQAPRMRVDSSLTVYSGTTIVTGSASTTGTVAFPVPATPSLLVQPVTLAPTTTGTVFLERLSDPTVRLSPTGTIPATIGTISGSTVWLASPATSSTTTLPVMYLVVDSMPLVVVETSTNQTLNAVSHRRTTATTRSFWGETTSSTTAIAASGSITFPTPLASGSTCWFPWPNRPFISAAELTLVPQGSSSEILPNYTPLTPSRSGTLGLGFGIPVSPDLLFDAVHVPTRFAGIHQTYTGDFSGQTGIFSTGSNAITTVNQLSSFREPGRVNLNTVPSDDVWNAVVAGQLATPVVSRTDSTIQTAPAQNMYATLSLASSTGTVIVSDTTSQLAVNLNPLHGIYTATRLANTTTPRSNVFGVWITLRESIPNDPDSVKYHRAFYIVDRSIPVGFEEGKDHNVWDCVRLRRIIE